MASNHDGRLLAIADLEGHAVQTPCGETHLRRNIRLTAAHDADVFSAFCLCAWVKGDLVIGGYERAKCATPEALDNLIRAKLKNLEHTFAEYHPLVSSS